MAENLRTASTVSKPDVKVDRGLQVLVAEDAPDELVIGRVLLQDEGRGEVAKLMRRHPYAEFLGDALDDLTAQRPLGLVAIELAGEEPGVVTATQARPEHSRGRVPSISLTTLGRGYSSGSSFLTSSGGMTRW